MYHKLPGYLPSSNLKFEDVPSGTYAISKVPAEGWLQWVAACGFCEIFVTCGGGEAKSAGEGLTELLPKRPPAPSLQFCLLLHLASPPTEGS